MLKIAAALALAAAIADSPPPTRHSTPIYDTRTIASAIALSGAGSVAMTTTATFASTPYR